MGFILRWISIVCSSAVLVPLLKRLAWYLGITAVSYVGFGALLDSLYAEIQQNWAGITADIVAWMSIAGIDRAFNILLSATAARLTLHGLTSAGVLQKVLWKPFQQGTLF